MSADAERLNRINVFPAPDGDTGANLAVMLGSVRQALLRHRERHAGAILAQFFLGLCDASVDHPLLTAPQFVNAVERGSSYARDALSEPREGTILTVIRDFGAELAAQLGGGCRQDFAALLEGGLRRAQQSLEATTQ